MNGSGCLELDLESKGETLGQMVGPLNSQREKEYGNRFEGRFQATYEEKECLGNCGDSPVGLGCDEGARPMILWARSENDQLRISFPPGLRWGNRRLGDYLRKYK